MILSTLCSSCLQPFEITVSAEDVRLLKEIRGDDSCCACPRLCGGRVPVVQQAGIEALARSPQLRDPLRITGRELYKAVGGAGLPDEVAVDPLFVSALMRSEKPLDIVTEQDGQRVYLHEIRFKDVTLHLTSGLRGAQVLKITKEKPHASQVP